MYAVQLNGLAVGMTLKSSRPGKKAGKPVIKEVLIEQVAEIKHTGTAVKIGRKVKHKENYWGGGWTETVFTNLPLDAEVELFEHGSYSE